MKRTGVILTLTSSLLLAACASGGGVNPGSRLRVEASAITAGPYGELWEIRVREYSDGSGAELTFSSSEGSQELNGSAILGREWLQAFTETVATQKFYELPAEISGEFVEFHLPDLYLTVCRARSCHKVNLYDPNRVGATPEGMRFFAVWQAVVEQLPLKSAIKWQGT